MEDQNVIEDAVFANSMRTSDALCLAHGFIDHFIGKHIEHKFCSVAVLTLEGRTLVHASMPNCSEHAAYLALTQAKQAAKGTETCCEDRIGGKGSIKGYFGSVVLPDKSLAVGFYVRQMRAQEAAGIVAKVSKDMD